MFSNEVFDTVRTLVTVLIAFWGWFVASRLMFRRHVHLGRARWSGWVFAPVLGLGGYASALLIGGAFFAPMGSWESRLPAGIFGLLLTIPYLRIFGRMHLERTRSQSSRVVGPDVSVAPSNAGLPKLPANYQFDYTDAYGNRSRRHVRVTGVGGRAEHPLLIGHCYEKKAMRHFRIDRIQGKLTDLDSGELIDAQDLTPLYKPIQTRRSSDDDDQPTVVFLGFETEMRDELASLAREHGYRIKTRPTSEDDEVVLGPEVTPEQRARVDELGCFDADEAEFREWLS